MALQLTDEVEREKLKRKLDRTTQQAKAKVEEVHSAYVVGVLTAPHHKHLH